jgi:hypothetical protein
VIVRGSEFSRQVAVDFEADADFDERRRGPSHDRFLVRLFRSDNPLITSEMFQELDRTTSSDEAEAGKSGAIVAHAFQSRIPDCELSVARSGTSLTATPGRQAGRSSSF